jgi:hypothetical protein
MLGRCAVAQPGPVASIGRMSPDDQDKLGILLEEIKQARDSERAFSEQLRDAKTRRETLEKTYQLFAGKPAPGAIPTPPSGAARRAGRRVSRDVIARAEAMMSAIRANGPMGPGQLLDAVRLALSDPEVTRAQVTDVLRRMDTTFESLGGGLWGLRGVNVTLEPAVLELRAPAVEVKP